jgi:hypothetical protein
LAVFLIQQRDYFDWIGGLAGRLAPLLIPAVSLKLGIDELRLHQHIISARDEYQEMTKEGVSLSVVSVRICRRT